MTSNLSLSIDLDCQLTSASEAALCLTEQGFKVLPPPALADILEGHFRPGFFVAVGKETGLVSLAIYPPCGLRSLGSAGADRVHWRRYQ